MTLQKFSYNAVHSSYNTDVIEVPSTSITVTLVFGDHHLTTKDIRTNVDEPETQLIFPVNLAL